MLPIVQFTTKEQQTRCSLILKLFTLVSLDCARLLRAAHLLTVSYRTESQITVDFSIVLPVTRKSAPVVKEAASLKR